MNNIDNSNPEIPIEDLKKNKKKKIFLSKILGVACLFFLLILLLLITYLKK